MQNLMFLSFGKTILFLMLCVLNNVAGQEIVFSKKLINIQLRQ